MKQCVITGAADGIGKAVAQRFGAAGFAITGIDRDAARSSQTEAELRSAGTTTTWITGDLANEQALNNIIAALIVAPPIDVLILNAGINAVGPFGRVEMTQQHAVLDVNLVTPLVLTAELLHHARFAAGGSAVYMSSLSHFVGYPGAAVYAASKDGLASYARSLAVSQPDLHVLTVYPGPTRTAHARRYSPDNRREQSRMPPEHLAASIFLAVMQRRRTLVPGLGNQAFAVVGRLFPRVTEWLMRKTLFEKLL